MDYTTPPFEFIYRNNSGAEFRVHERADIEFLRGIKFDNEYGNSINRLSKEQAAQLAKWIERADQSQIEVNFHDCPDGLTNTIFREDANIFQLIGLRIANETLDISERDLEKLDRWIYEDYLKLSNNPKLYEQFCPDVLNRMEPEDFRHREFVSFYEMVSNVASKIGALKFPDGTMLTPQSDLNKLIDKESEFAYQPRGNTFVERLMQDVQDATIIRFVNERSVQKDREPDKLVSKDWTIYKYSMNSARTYRCLAFRPRMRDQ